MTYEADFALKVAIQSSERASIEFFNNMLDFRKVVTHRGATLRFSMMVCTMRLGRHNDA